eukprot:gene7686-8493_t
MEEKVVVAPSKISGAGNGLFAKEFIARNELICLYSGRLIDAVDCKYVDPTYTVEFEYGKGFKLLGDFEDGNPGMYANSIHPKDPSVEQNARYDLGTKRFHREGRGCFSIMASKDIQPGEEIIVNYGQSYWATMARFLAEGAPSRPESVLARDERAKRRQLRIAAAH